MAETDKSSIYFYAELGSPTDLTSSSETMTKVHDSLGEVGLTENQVLYAIGVMQRAGILFRERAI